MKYLENYIPSFNLARVPKPLLEKLVEILIEKNKHINLNANGAINVLQTMAPRMLANIYDPDMESAALLEYADYEDAYVVESLIELVKNDDTPII